MIYNTFTLFLYSDYKHSALFLLQDNIFSSYFFPSGPEVVSNIIAIGSTTNMSVSWTLAIGQVFSYSVLLLRNISLQASNMNLSNNIVNTQFMDLTPGVLYCVMVVSKSGPFESNSSVVCNATCELQPHCVLK